MPRRKDNPKEAISAIFGDRVEVETRGKKFIVTKLKPRRRKKSSPSQETRQRKFTMAVAFAKSVLRDPKLKKAYERKRKGHRNAYQAALAEYMRKNLQ